MTDLAQQTCRPRTGDPLAPRRAEELLARLGGWRIEGDGRVLAREFAFDDFDRTMAFVNAVADVARVEDHHPDLEVGYARCRVSYTTHSVGGLSENDFICAAKIDALVEGL